MTKFRIGYRRTKPAGVISFDPNLEFVDVFDIHASTPEEATQRISRDMPWMSMTRIEKLVDAGQNDTESQPSLLTSSVLPSGARTMWPNDPGISGNVSRIGGSFSAFVSSYSRAQAQLEILRVMGVPEDIVKPLRQDIEIMQNTARSEKDQLEKALVQKTSLTLNNLAAESEQNGERQLLASQIVNAIVSCNLLSNKVLGCEFFNASPEIVNTLHTPCRNENEFKIKIGALSLLFDVELKRFREKVRDAEDDWKSIKLLGKWAEQNSLTYDPYMFEVWRNVVELRNTSFPFHKTDERILRVLSFFGQAYPPNYEELWKVILNRLLASLMKLIELFSIA